MLKFLRRSCQAFWDESFQCLQIQASPPRIELPADLIEPADLSDEMEEFICSGAILEFVADDHE